MRVLTLLVFACGVLWGQQAEWEAAVEGARAAYASGDAERGAAWMERALAFAERLDDERDLYTEQTFERVREGDRQR